MKCAALQMVSSHDVQANLRQAALLVRQAAASGVELMVLPEYFCLMGQNDRDKLAVCEREGDGPIQQALARMARDAGVWLVGGTLPLAVDGDAQRVRNSCLVFNPQGEQVARYDKIHLFRFARDTESYDESRLLQAGSQPVTFVARGRDGRDWRVGLSICYDLRFPELYRSQDADIWVVPSAFTFTTGAAHWEVLLRARAIENQCWVIAAAQGGRHSNGRQTWGHSLVIDPWGQVLALQAQGEAVVAADFDPQHQHEWRQQLPALNHRVLGRAGP